MVHNLVSHNIKGFGGCSGPVFRKTTVVYSGGSSRYPEKVIVRTGVIDRPSHYPLDSDLSVDMNIASGACSLIRLTLDVALGCLL
jgi:hypothetical protein